MRAIGLTIAAILLLGAAGCGREGDRTSVRAVADRFFAALDSGDGDLACGLLSPDTRAALESQEQRACREAVTDLELDGGSVARVDVFVTNAVAELSSGETAFLDAGEEGWRLSALGCKPQGNKPADRPFDCELES